MAQTLMILGTASDVGKSLIVTGLCRLFSRAGARVAPFKAQNISNNAYACFPDGEIGWAQALQAWACGLEPNVDMNPLLLKPSSEQRVQVVVQGKVWKTASAWDCNRFYFQDKIKESFTRLSRTSDLLVLEGAGGAAEINLKDRDIANFAMADMADAPVLLVADIDRGGVFASLVGTMELLEPAQRERVKGFIINKFRGDLSLLEPGLRMLEARTGRPVLGVLPYLPDIALEAEDSVCLETYYKKQPSFGSSSLNIAVVGFPHIANFTDFLPLSQLRNVRLNYVRTPEEIVQADVVVLPGSKDTIADLRWLKSENWFPMLNKLRQAGRWIVGVCGGYQMLGQEVADPFGVEGRPTVEVGLGFLPLRTELGRSKTTRRVEGQWRIGTERGVFDAYEIHMGQTQVLGDVMPRFWIRYEGIQSQPDGAVSQEGKVWGTYLHGLFESGPFLRAWFGQVVMDAMEQIDVPWRSWRVERAAQCDRLASAVEQALDMPAIWALVENRQR